MLNGIPQFFSHEAAQPLAAPAAIPLNTWTHVAATFDGATKMLYVNGIQVAAQGGLGPIAYAPAPVGIGATWQTDTTTADLFTGSVEEVSLYNRAHPRRDQRHRHRRGRRQEHRGPIYHHRPSTAGRNNGPAVHPDIHLRPGNRTGELHPGRSKRDAIGPDPHHGGHAVRDAHHIGRFPIHSDCD